VIGLRAAADTTVSNRLRKFLPADAPQPGKVARIILQIGKNDLFYLLKTSKLRFRFIMKAARSHNALN
jgi:hypothetical protein